MSGFSAQPPHRWRLCLSQHAISVYIIRKVSQTNLGFGPDYPDRSYKQAACPHSLNSEYMFDSASNLRSIIITLYLTLGQFFITTTLSLNMAAKSFLTKSIAFFSRAIGRIRPYISATVIFIKKLIKNFAVMNRRGSNFIVTNNLILNIYVDMILVTKLIVAVLLCPASICIFLAFGVLAPAIRDIAVLDGFILLSAVTLFGSRYYACINYLTFFSRKAVFTQKIIKLLEKYFDKFSFTKLSLNSHIVLASGTISPRDKSRKRIKDKRSLT